MYESLSLVPAFFHSSSFHFPLSFSSVSLSLAGWLSLCACLSVCLSSHTYTHTNTHTHTCMHTHTYTHNYLNVFLVTAWPWQLKYRMLESEIKLPCDKRRFSPSAALADWRCKGLRGNLTDWPYLCCSENGPVSNNLSMFLTECGCIWIVQIM